MRPLNERHYQLKAPGFAGGLLLGWYQVLQLFDQLLIRVAVRPRAQTATKNRLSAVI